MTDQEAKARSVELEFERVNAEITKRALEQAKILAEREKFLAEERSERVFAVCVATPIVIVVLSIAFLIWTAIDTPNAQSIQPGTRIDCIVKQ